MTSTCTAGRGKSFSDSFSALYDTAVIISQQSVRKYKNTTVAIARNYASTKQLGLHLYVEFSKYCTLH